MTDQTPFPAGTFTPRPGRAPLAAMVRAAVTSELRIALRNGEQLMLAIVIPVAALLVLTLTSVVELPAPRINSVVPGVVALAVLSSAFTSQAITTGFDRKYGVLQRLSATGMPRWLLLAGKYGAVLALIGVQLAVLLPLAAVLGWRPTSWWPLGLPLVLLAAAGLTGFALLIGGLLRAEAVLAVANLWWLLLVGIGGVILPLTRGPGWLRALGEATPVGALSQGLRAVAVDNQPPPGQLWLVLLGWVLVTWLAAVRWFKWA